MLWNLFLFHCPATNTGLVDVFLSLLALFQDQMLFYFASFARQSYNIDEVFPMEKIYGIIFED